MSHEAPVANSEAERLTAFTERLHHWQDRFDTAEAGSINDWEIEEATSDLEDTWPYKGVACFYSGYMNYPHNYGTDRKAELISSGVYDDPEDEDNEDDFYGSDMDLDAFDDKWDYVESRWGTSDGFEIGDLQNTGRPQIYFKFFETEVEEKYSLTHQVTHTLFSYVSSNGVVIPLSVFERSAHDVQAVPELANIQSPEQLAVALNNLMRSTTFRRQNIRRQRSQVQGMIRAAEQLFPTDDCERSIEATQLFVPRILDGIVEYQPETIHGDTSLNGEIVGYGCLEERRLDQRPIRRDADMISRHAGLCALVNINRTKHDYPSNILYVPMANNNFSETVVT